MAFPSTPILDDFDRADEGPPPSTNWTNGFVSGLVVNGNEVAGTVVGDNSQAYWNTQYGPDCEAYITITVVDSLVALAIRAQDPEWRVGGYMLTWGTTPNTLALSYSDISGSTTELDSDLLALNNGDSIGIRAVGDVIEGWYKPASGEWTLVLSATDISVNNAGYILLVVRDTISRIDNVGGGNYTPPPEPTSVVVNLPQSSVFYQPEQITVWLSTPGWQRIALLDYFLRLEYKRVLGAVGLLKIDLPSWFNTLYLQEDAIIEVERGYLGGQYLDTETVWFVRDWDFVLNDRGEEFITAHAYCANFIIDSRIVAYKAGTSQAVKSGLADDVMKAYVREQLTTATETARNITSYVQVQDDLGQGPTIAKSAPQAKLLTTLQEISQDAAKAGIEIYFDMMCPERGRLEFRTYMGQRGQDHGPESGSRVILSPNMQSLTSVRRSYQTNAERNVIYVGGQGQEESRNVITVQDSARAGLSAFNRREMFLNRNNEADSQLESEGQAALRLMRPREVFSSKVSNNASAKYGRDWGFGDVVEVEYRGESGAAMVEAVKTLVSRGEIQTEADVRVGE